MQYSNRKPIGKFKHDTPDFREKQKTLPSRVQALKDKATPAERHIQSILSDSPYTWKFQKGFIAYDYYCIVDFCFPSYNIVLEIDGEYHNPLEQKVRDERKDQYLRDVRKQHVVRLTNQQALSIKSFTELERILDPNSTLFKTQAWKRNLNP
jgi:very-short-patch-repair endonuclease